MASNFEKLLSNGDDGVTTMTDTAKKMREEELEENCELTGADASRPTDLLHAEQVGRETQLGGEDPVEKGLMNLGLDGNAATNGVIENPIEQNGDPVVVTRRDPPRQTRSGYLEDGMVRSNTWSGDQRQAATHRQRQVLANDQRKPGSLSDLNSPSPPGSISPDEGSFSFPERMPQINVTGRDNLVIVNSRDVTVGGSNARPGSDSFLPGIRSIPSPTFNTDVLSKDHFGRWEDQITALLNPSTDRIYVGDQNLFYTTGSKISGNAGNHVYVGLRDQKDYVAVKRCLSENVGKEILVAKSLMGKQLKHVLTFTDIIKDGLFTYYVSDLCLENLKSLIEEGSRAPLSLQRRLSICRQILQGQMELHDNGIVHRDLKPSNILFDHNGEVLIADFDISRLLNEKTSTITNGVGSQCWMSSEVLDASDGHVVYRRSSDIEMSGRLLYYVLTEGHHPYEDTFPYTRHPVKVTQNILQNKYSLEHLHDCRHLGGLLSAMMDPDPAKRPTISECLQLLKHGPATQQRIN